MAKRNIKFNLELYNKDILPKFAIKQFDNALINIDTYAGGDLFNPVGNTCKLYVSVGGEVFLQSNKISVLENGIEIDLDKNIISTVGKALGELELSDSNGILTSATFLFNIESKIGEGSTIPGQVEGFIAKHERLIKEFKEEYNSRLEILQTELNTNTNRIDQVESKNSEQDKRLVDIEKKNKVQDVYMRGLFNENKDGRLTIDGDGNSLKLEGSKEGLVEVEKVVGNTLVNLANPLEVGSRFRTPYKLDLTKTYTFILEFDSNMECYCFVEEANTWSSITPQVKVVEGHNKIIVKNILNNITYAGGNDLVIGVRVNGVSNSNVKFTNLTRILLEGDYTNNPIPNEYFEGMKSVGEVEKNVLEIRVQNKNLFNINETNTYSNNAICEKSGNSLRITPTKSSSWVDYNIKVRGLKNGETYTLSCISDDYHLSHSRIALYERESNSRVGSWSDDYFTIPNNVDVENVYLRIHCSDNDVNNLREVEISDIQIEEGTQATPYEPYYERTQTVYLNNPLLKGDEIVCIDGELKHYHKMNRVLFNGGIGEEWIHADNTLTNTYRVRINLPDATGDTLIANYPVIIQGTSIEDNEHLQLSDKNLFLRVLKTNATTVDDVKTWLQSNPLTIVYELAEPYYETIDTDRLLLEIPNNATINVKSVVPVQSMTATYTGSIPSVYNMENSIQAIEDHNIEIIATTFDMDYRLLEVEWTLEDAGLTGISLANTFNINKNIIGGKTMALSRYEQAKIMILGGVYDKATLTNQLTRYLEKNIITKGEYDDLMSLMEAKELVTGE